MYRARRQSLRSIASLLLIAIALFVALPGAAAASAVDRVSSEAAGQDPAAATFAIPGYFSLTFGQEFSVTPEGLTLESAELAIPGANAVATVTGLSLDKNLRLLGWDSIAVTQNQPLVTDTYSIADAQLSVGGPGSGYLSAATATLDLRAGQDMLVNGTFGIVYRLLANAFGLGVRDGNASIQAGPLGVTLKGTNTQPGEMTIDELSGTIAGTGGMLEVSGFQSGPRGVDWETLDVSQAAVAIGNVLTVSPLEVRVGNSTSGYATKVVVGLALDAGDVAQARGNITTVYDGATRATELSLQDGSGQVLVEGFTLGFDGLFLGPSGTKIDSLKLRGSQAGVTAEVNGLAVDPVSQAIVFDRMTIQYQPEGTTASSGGGYVMQIDRTDAGYVLTTSPLAFLASN